jgi:hypothetical protein
MSIASTFVTSCPALRFAGRCSPEASLRVPVQTCGSRFAAAGTSLEGERAAAPVARRRRFCGPCVNKNFSSIWRLKQ